MKKITWLLLSGMLLFSPSLALAAPSLKAGDPAPAIKVAKWLKGPPIESFGNGSIDVLEFWATWHGPSKTLIPHLSELAKKYEGKVRIAGVSIWEAEKTDQAKRLDTVSKFVTSMGDKMAYSVAADDNEGFMAKNWMIAAGENGIPVIFIIDKDGRIAWIGEPSRMDDILAQVVAGTLDSKAVAAEADKIQKDREAKRAHLSRLKEVSELYTKGKNQEAIAALDKVLATNPDLAQRTEFLRYKLLLGYDEAAAYQQARKLLDGPLKDDANALYTIARDMNENKQLKHPDRDLAIAAAKRAAELRHNNDAATTFTLASAYFLKGDIDDAVTTGELAVKQADANPKIEAASRKYVQTQLDVYKAKQQQTAAPANTR